MWKFQWEIIRISSPDSGSTVVEAALVDGVDGVAVVVTIVSTEKLSLSILVLEFLSIVKLNSNFFIPDSQSYSISNVNVFFFGFSEHVILLFFMLSRSPLMRKSLKVQFDSNFPLVNLRVNSTGWKEVEQVFSEGWICYY